MRQRDDGGDVGGVRSERAVENEVRDAREECQAAGTGKRETERRDRVCERGEITCLRPAGKRRGDVVKRAGEKEEVKCAR